MTLRKRGRACNRNFQTHRPTPKKVADVKIKSKDNVNVFLRQKSDNAPRV
jgi:hypothetical protein